MMCSRRRRLDRTQRALSRIVALAFLSWQPRFVQDSRQSANAGPATVAPCDQSVEVSTMSPSANLQSDQNSIKPIAALVVSPDPALLQSLVRALRESCPGHGFLRATTGRDALRYLGSYPAPILLLDDALPDISAVYLATLVKALSPGTHVFGLASSEAARRLDSLPASSIDHWMDRASCVGQVGRRIAEFLRGVAAGTASGCTP